MIAADCSMRKLAISGTQGRCAAFRAPAKAASRTNRRSAFVVRATDAPTDQEKKDAEELKAVWSPSSSLQAIVEEVES